jgi:hypothetical protein
MCTARLIVAEKMHGVDVIYCLHEIIGQFLIVGSRDQVTCTLLPSRQLDSSPLLDHVTQLSGCELCIT